MNNPICLRNSLDGVARFLAKIPIAIGRQITFENHLGLGVNPFKVRFLVLKLGLN